MALRDQIGLVAVEPGPNGRYGAQFNERMLDAYEACHY